MKISQWEKVIGVVLGLPLVIITGIWFLDSLVDLHSLTYTRLKNSEMRIKTYYKANNRLPDRLEQLPARGPHSVLVDCWDQPIQYIVDGHDVTLLSYGKDGQPGGTGDYADIIVTFTVGEATSKPTSRPCDTKNNKRK